MLGVQVASALRDLYGRNGAETISGLCGTRVVLAAPDRDTAQWSADSLGRSEVEEVAEGFSYGANTIRDGVSLTPRRELRALALPSEIMRLAEPGGLSQVPRPLPGRLHPPEIRRPAEGGRAVRAARGGRSIARCGRPSGRGYRGIGAVAEPGGDGGMAIPALPGEAGAEPAGAPRRRTRRRSLHRARTGRSPCRCRARPRTRRRAPESPRSGEPGTEGRETTEGQAPGAGPGIAI